MKKYDVVSTLLNNLEAYQKAKTSLLLRFGTIQAAAAAVWEDRTLTDTMTLHEKEVVAYELLNLTTAFKAQDAPTLAVLKTVQEKRNELRTN